VGRALVVSSWARFETNGPMFLFAFFLSSPAVKQPKWICSTSWNISLKDLSLKSLIPDDDHLLLLNGFILSKTLDKFFRSLLKCGCRSISRVRSLFEAVIRMTERIARSLERRDSTGPSEFRMVESQLSELALGDQDLGHSCSNSEIEGREFADSV
jgi:hypothetical protein